jgi:hypothetical protein
VLYLAPVDGSVCNAGALHLLVGCFGGVLVMLPCGDDLVLWCCGDDYFILDAGWMVSSTQPRHRLLPLFVCTTVSNNPSPLHSAYDHGLAACACAW